MTNLTEYLETELNPGLNRLIAQIAAADKHDENTKAPFQTHPALRDSLCRRRDAMQREIKTIEQTICKAKNSKANSVFVKTLDIIAVFGDIGLRSLESRFTTRFDFDKSSADEHEFIVNEFDFVRLTTELRSGDVSYRVPGEAEKEAEPSLLEKLRPELQASVERVCGTTNVVADGIQCTYCGALETYKPADDIENVDRWAFIIRAFRVDDSSECRNCKKWFTC